MGIRWLLGACMVLGMVQAGAAPLAPLETTAQFRAAAVDAERGLVYVAAYDADAVWYFDPSSWERVDRVATGKQPVALALSSDNQTLAVVNRGDATLSLIDLSTNTILLDAPTGDGPMDVAALPGGRFVVANSFSDSLTLVDSDGNVSTINGVGGVPVALAAAGKHVAVVCRTAQSARLFRDLSGKGSDVPLPFTPATVEALANGSFAVGGIDGIAIIDGDSSRISAKSNQGALALAADEDRLFALTDTGIRVLDGMTLATVDTYTLDSPAQILAAGSGVLAAIAPAEQKWYVWNASGLTRLAAAPVAVAAAPSPARAASPAVAAPATGDAPQIVDAEPADATAAVKPSRPAPNAVGFATKTAPDTTAKSPEPAPVPEVLSQPGAVAIEEAVEETETSPSPQQMAAAASPAPQPAVEMDTQEPGTTPPPAQAGITTPKKNGLSPYPAGEALQRKNTRPQFGEETRAPRLNRRPSALPIQDFSGKSLSEALESGANFGPAESLFLTPDWTKPLENLEADEMGGSFDSDLVEATGNVRLNLGDTRFQADYFSYRESTGEMHAKGNVVMEQPTSLLTADEVFYTLPADREAPPPPPLEAPEDDPNKRRLSMGRLQATNVHIQEPTREMRVALLDYDAMAGTGSLTGVEGSHGQFYFGAEELAVGGPKTMSAKNVWVTTCDTKPAPYRIVLSELEVKDGVPTSGKNARLQVANLDTPLFLPVWRRSSDASYPFMLDFDSGRQADLGFFINVGQRFQVTPDIMAGPRVFATEKEGVGFGGDVEYDFMSTPNSWLYRTEGEVHGLYTTEDRSYIHWYNRYEPSDDLVVRMQAEHWGDSQFYKDFYYEEFRNRTTPRSFANATYTQDDYIATGTVRLNSHGWVSETERYPEGTFHLLERELVPHTYVTVDSVTGVNEREPAGPRAVRTVNTARVTYDWDVTEAINVAPYYELELAWYSREREDHDAAFRVGNNFGVTAQTRLHRVYDGAFGFSAFKHVVVPSVTYTYRPSTSLDAVDTPLYDALDSSFGRSRIETKLDNIVFGKDAVTGEVWQVGRLSLYQGNDFWNEFSTTEDYEIEIDIRPRPWWGMQLVGERHVASDDLNLDAPFLLERINLTAFERLTGRPYSAEANYAYNASYGDYNRMLAQLYYNDEMLGGHLQGRIGFAYTETQGRVFNREILYGVGYQLSEEWGLGFEHRYDFEDHTLRSQTYEVRRRFNCWESALRVRNRESGTDIDLEISISAFPASRVKF